MTITKKNGELEEALEKLNAALAEKTPLPPRVSYTIVKNKLSLEKALEAFRKTRDEIINEHSGGKGHVSEKDDPSAFAAVCEAIAAIAKEPTEIDIATIKISELGDKELPLDLIAALGFMITDE